MAASPICPQLRGMRARDPQLLQLACSLLFTFHFPLSHLSQTLVSLAVSPVSSLRSPCELHVRVGRPWPNPWVAPCPASLLILWLFWLLSNPTLGPLHTHLPKYQFSLPCPTGLPRIPLDGGWVRWNKEVWQSAGNFDKKPGDTRKLEEEGTKDIWTAKSWRQVQFKIWETGLRGQSWQAEKPLRDPELSWEVLRAAKLGLRPGIWETEGTEQVAGDNCQTGHLFLLCSCLATSQRYCWPLKGQGKARQTGENSQQKGEPQWPRQFHPGKREAARWVLWREC